MHCLKLLVCVIVLSLKLAKMVFQCWKGEASYKSKVVQRCLYSYQQQYSSSQWSNFCGLTRHNILRQRKCLFQRVTKILTCKKEEALSTTFSQYDWFISQNEHSWLAVTLHDKFTWEWREQGFLDSNWQWQISQSDCEITSSCGKILFGLVKWIYLNKIK